MRSEFTGQKNGVATDMTSLSKCLFVGFKQTRNFG